MAAKRKKRVPDETPDVIAYPEGTPVAPDGTARRHVPVDEEWARNNPMDEESSRIAKQHAEVRQRKAAGESRVHWNAQAMFAFEQCVSLKPGCTCVIKQISPIQDDGIPPVDADIFRGEDGRPDYTMLVAHIRDGHFQHARKNNGAAIYKWWLRSPSQPSEATATIHLFAEEGDDPMYRRPPPPPPGYGYPPQQPPPYGAPPPGYGYPPQYPPPVYQPNPYAQVYPPPPQYQQPNPYAQQPPPPQAAPQPGAPPPPQAPSVQQPAAHPPQAAPQPPPPPMYQHPPAQDPAVAMLGNVLNQLLSERQQFYQQPPPGYYYPQPAPQAAPPPAPAPPPPVDPMASVRTTISQVGELLNLSDTIRTNLGRDQEATQPNPTTAAGEAPRDGLVVREMPHMRFVSTENGEAADWMTQAFFNGDKIKEFAKEMMSDLRKTIELAKSGAQNPNASPEERQQAQAHADLAAMRMRELEDLAEKGQAMSQQMHQQQRDIELKAQAVIARERAVAEREAQLQTPGPGPTHAAAATPPTYMPAVMNVPMPAPTPPHVVPMPPPTPPVQDLHTVPLPQATPPNGEINRVPDFVTAPAVGGARLPISN